MTSLMGSDASTRAPGAEASLALKMARPWRHNTKRNKPTTSAGFVVLGR